MNHSLINIVIGSEINKDFSNITNFESTLIPNVDDVIVSSTFGKLRVNSRTFDYRQIDEYFFNDEERGKEKIFLFCTKLA